MQNYIEIMNRLARASNQAYKEQRDAWIKARRSPRTFKYNPPQWICDTIDAVGRGDEEAAKSIMLYRSVED